MHHSIRMTGNCIIQDITHTLSVIPDTSRVTNVHIMRKYDLIERQPILDDHDYADVLEISELYSMLKCC